MNENKQLIQHVFAELEAGNAKPFTDVLADDVRWTIIGNTRWSRTFAGKSAVLAELLTPLRAQIDGRIQVTAHRFIAEDTREVTFANGAVVRERIVDLNDRARRIAYSAVGGRFTHHSASIQVFPDGDTRSRVVWIADLLPDDIAELVGGMMEQGCAAMKRTLEQSNPILDRQVVRAEA